MNTHDVKVFGYGEFAKEIVEQVNEVYRSVTVYVLDQKSLEEVQKSGGEACLFDLGDNWDEFDALNMDETLFICALDDDASNVFLTISLRDQFPDARLIAIASTQEHASKLRLAGAHKVISKLQATADILIEVLEKPIVTHVIQDILDEETLLKTMQLEITASSLYVGRNLADVSLQEHENIIILAVVSREFDTLFVFTARGSRHILEVGDVLVAIGYDEELESFKRRMQ